MNTAQVVDYTVLYLFVCAGTQHPKEVRAYDSPVSASLFLGIQAMKSYQEGIAIAVTLDMTQPLKYVFSAPDYPWNGVAGAELYHATLDPIRARAWLEAGANGRLARIFERVSDHGESPLSLSEWSIWIRAWINREPEPRPYVVLPPSAKVLARTIQQEPGDMWQRIREQLLWKPQTMDDAQKLISRVAGTQRDLPFSTFYLWARMARWYEQHEHEPQSPPAPNTWTDQLARQCLRDRAFWDEYPRAEDLLALDKWITTNPLDNNPVLDELLAQYTHWLARSHGSRAVAAVTMLPHEWTALATAWMDEFQGNPAYGRDLAWLAQTRKLVPSLERGKDPMTFRSLMMMALTELIKEEKIIPQGEENRPWDTPYVLSPQEAESIRRPQRTLAPAQVPAGDDKANSEAMVPDADDPKESLDPQWARLVELWRQSFDSEAVSIERILTVIQRDGVLVSLLPEDPRNQRPYMRHVVIPHLSELDIPVTISRFYHKRGKKSLYTLSSSDNSVGSAPGDRIDTTETIPKERPQSMTVDTEDRMAVLSDVNSEDIAEFLAGWRRTFGQTPVSLDQLLTKGRENGWLFSLPPHSNPGSLHPLTEWLTERLNRPQGPYRIEQHAEGYTLSVISDQTNAHDMTPPPATAARQPVDPLTVTPLTPSSSTALGGNPAAVIEHLTPSDKESAFWDALTPWVPWLENVGPEWFTEWFGLHPQVYERIRHLWPVLVTRAGQSHRESLKEENERLKRLLGEKELQLSQARDVLKKHGLVSG